MPKSILALFLTLSKTQHQENKDTAFDGLILNILLLSTQK
jgi:hypothetical protein